MKSPGDARRQYLEWLQPKPLVHDFNDIDMRTITALGGVPPPHFMKARSD